MADESATYASENNALSATYGHVTPSTTSIGAEEEICLIQAPDLSSSSEIDMDLDPLTEDHPPPPKINQLYNTASPSKGGLQLIMELPTVALKTKKGKSAMKKTPLPSAMPAMPPQKSTRSASKGV